MTRLDESQSWNGDAAGSVDEDMGAAPMTSVEARPAPAASESPKGSAIDVAGLAKMLLIVAAIVAVFIAAGWSALLIVIAAIIVIVMVHELGHFATAKWAGMKVTEYFVGFGPRLWSIRKGETDYGFKPILAGGYVKIIGMTNLEEVDPADEPRTYRQQAFHKRIIVASAGSFMHFVMAFLLLYAAILSFGHQTGAFKPGIAGFSHWSGHAQTAAQQAGLRTGDQIVTVNGHAITGNDQLGKAINSSPGRPVHLTVERAGKVIPITVTPALGHKTASGTEVLGRGTGTQKSVGLIGVEFAGFPNPVFAPEGPVRALGTAGHELATITGGIVTSVPHAFANAYHAVTNPKVAAQTAQTGDRPQSIYGATDYAMQAFHHGVYYLILVLVLLNIAFGILNMLPMLPLDGGHVAIAVYERIRTRKGHSYYRADAAKLMPVVYTFVAVLAIFSVSILYLDISHPVQFPH
jgi:membrane-associated protease RseP (regulator of RpoE activity)